MSYGHSGHRYCDACYCNELDEAIAERDAARAELAALREELHQRDQKAPLLTRDEARRCTCGLDAHHRDIGPTMFTHRETCPARDEEKR